MRSAPSLLLAVLAALSVAALDGCANADHAPGPLPFDTVDAAAPPHPTGDGAVFPADAGSDADTGAAQSHLPDLGADALPDAAHLADGPVPTGDAALAPADAAIPADSAQVPVDAALPPDAEPDAGPAPRDCVPAAEPLPDLAVETDGRFVRFPHFPSAHVAPRRVTVYLPAGDVGDTPLPVLYMHDGQNVFFDEEATFGVSWGALGTIDALAADGIPLVVVAVDNTPDRMSEYTPIPDPDYPEGGGADAYGRFLVEELKPYIDYHFPTSCRPRDSAVVGSSLGGLVSLYLGATYPDVYGRIGAVSPSLWWGNNVAQSWVPALAAALDAPGRRLYLDAGNAEGAEATDVPDGPNGRGRVEVLVNGRNLMEALSTALPAARRPTLSYIEDPGAAHNEAAWRDRLPNTLHLLYGDPVGPAVDRELWVWAPVLRPGEFTHASIFAHDAAGRAFSLLGADGAVQSAAPNLAGVDVDGAITARAAGRVQILPAAVGPNAGQALYIAGGAEARIHLVAHVPEGTDVVYLTGSLALLGPWEADGLPLRPLDATTFEGDLVAPVGVRFEYKLTRGTFDTVEKDAAGNELANRVVTPEHEVTLEATVASWADSF